MSLWLPLVVIRSVSFVTRLSAPEATKDGLFFFFFSNHPGQVQVYR